MDYDDVPTLHVAIEVGVAWVTIDNPPLNIMDAALMTDLDRFAGQVRDDAAVRVIVFQSADPDFFIPHGDMGFVDDPGAFAGLPAGVIAATKRALPPTDLGAGPARENDAWEGLFVLPAAERLIRGGLAHGAQTRDGERRLEKLLRKLEDEVRDESAG